MHRAHNVWVTSPSCPPTFDRPWMTTRSLIAPVLLTASCSWCWLSWFCSLVISCCCSSFLLSRCCRSADTAVVLAESVTALTTPPTLTVLVLLLYESLYPPTTAPPVEAIGWCIVNDAEFSWLVLVLDVLSWCVLFMVWVLIYLICCGIDGLGWSCSILPVQKNNKLRYELQENRWLSMRVEPDPSRQCEIMM